MSKLILLLVGAEWMAVLLPPLFRSRIDSRPVSSITEFRRQLYSLQRTQAPLRAQAPMRAMARPLAQAPRAQAPRVADRAAARMRVVSSSTPDESAATARRRHHNADHTRSHLAPETAFMSTRDIVRRRRTNALYALIGANLLTLFLAFTTGSGAMIWAFAVAVAALVGYCWMLVQIRTQEQMRRHRQRYFSAA